MDARFISMHCRSSIRGGCSALFFPFLIRNLDIPLPLQPCRYYSPKVTDAFSDHDASYQDQCSSDVDCDAIVAVAHDYDYYYYCYCYSAATIGAASSSCFSCDDFETRF